MTVRIDKARQHGFSTQVDLFGRAPESGQRLFFTADKDNLSFTRHDSFSVGGLSAVHRQDLTAVKKC